MELSGLPSEVGARLQAAQLNQKPERPDAAAELEKLFATFVVKEMRRGLPQGFFDERPVGRITFYFNQLDKMRDFLISKALTSILDFGFSFLFLAVLWWISPTLTLITISSLPLFIELAFIANPLIEDLIGRTVKEAIQTNSYLMESITGIQPSEPRTPNSRHAGCFKTATRASSMRTTSSK